MGNPNDFYPDAVPLTPIQRQRNSEASFIREIRSSVHKPKDYYESLAVESGVKSGSVLESALIVIVAIVLCVFLIAGCTTEAVAENVDMSIISMIESSGCKNLVGDNGKALGCHQLHAGVVKDYNKKYGTDFIHWDVMNDDVSYMIANWYMNTEVPRLLKHYGVKDTLEARLSFYNMKHSEVIKGKRATSYIKKYKAIDL